MSGAETFDGKRDPPWLHCLALELPGSVFLNVRRCYHDAINAARREALEEAADECWGHINAEIEESPELADIPPDAYSRGYRDCANRLALKYRAKSKEARGE